MGGSVGSKSHKATQSILNSELKLCAEGFINIT